MEQDSNPIGPVSSPRGSSGHRHHVQIGRVVPPGMARLWHRGRPFLGAFRGECPDLGRPASRVVRTSF